MASDARFYISAESLSLADLAARTGAELAVPAGAKRLIRGVASLEAADASEVTYLASSGHLKKVALSRAAACYVQHEYASHLPSHVAALLCREPDRAFAAAAKLFFQVRRTWTGISDRATVAASARLGKDVNVAPGAVIADEVDIGDRTTVGANAVIGPGVAIGRDGSIGDNATVSFSLIGDRVVLQAGVRVGQDGFGFASNKAGHVRIPQLGRVIVQDDVEIGANSTVDRGSGGDTVIGEGTKIDNLVHIGHNCRVGRHCILVAQVGLSGSVILGDFVVLAGKVGVIDHIVIGDGARVAARSGVTSDVPAGAVYGGFPAKPIGDWRREAVILKRLVEETRKKPRSSGNSG